MSSVVGVATPNPALSQVKLVAVCLCGEEIYCWAEKGTATPIVPDDNLWRHERTSQTVCSQPTDTLIEQWPVYRRKPAEVEQ